METAHRCKLCFRNFANGKALGGHMRSHVMNLCTAKKGSKREKDEDPSENFDDSRSCLSISSRSSSGNEEGKRQSFEKGSVSGDPAEFCSVDVQDWESETDSSRKDLVIRRRSKRARYSRSVSGSDLKGATTYHHVLQIKNSTASETTEALSSISDTTSEDEDVAYCLMMLSRDKWKRGEKEKVFEDDGHEEYSDDVLKVKKGASKLRGEYRCKTCNEMFRSYQALGGHRASHKKIKVNPIASTSETSPHGFPTAERVHECPFCNRVFASGQALGGHKRSHFVGAVPRIGGTLSIDLNLPAPVDDDGT
ncbi:zinc finger protein ZAT9-like [Primulina eburnea]|uniref:zinc finger protein ZAT9-like n=1 Tax=Primulina eburnea TaxID=1245227 RepID=UPI003C6C685A